MLTASACTGATQVNILVKDGGNKLLQIQDNGHGIQVPGLLYITPWSQASAGVPHKLLT